MSLARVGFCRFSVRTPGGSGNGWGTVFQGSAAEVREYLSGIYRNPRSSLKTDGFRVYGGEGSTRARMGVVELTRHGVL